MIDDLSLPASVSVRTGDLLIRRATADDLDAIVLLLADDPISAARGDVADDGDRDAYAAALARIVESPANELLVAVGPGGTVVGTMQLTLIPGMARRGSARLLVEAVRVASAERSAGIGSAMMRWVVEVAAVEFGASLVQLTSDAARVDAHRFYRRLGFVDSHVGFKYAVPRAGPPAR